MDAILSQRMVFSSPSSSGSTDQNQRALGNQAGFKGEGSSISNAMTLSGTMLWELHRPPIHFSVSMLH